MYRVALNVAISAYRRATRPPHLLELDDRFSEPLPAAEQDDSERELLHEHIEQLDPLHRALLVLYLDDRPYREIGEILGISESNVGTKIARVKQRLRRAISSASTV